MKVTIYSSKGGCGKTALSIGIAIDKGYAVASNESDDAYSGFIEDDRVLFVAADEEFPKMPKGIDVVFDLAGTMNKHDFAVVSALKQSDVVVVPIESDRLSVRRGVRSIRAAHSFGAKVIVVATKLKKKRAGQTWEESKSFKVVCEAVASLHDELNYEPAVLPLKSSEGFGAVIDDCTSVHEMAKKSGLARYTYKELLFQIENIYGEIEKHG